MGRVSIFRQGDDRSTTGHMAQDDDESTQIDGGTPRGRESVGEGFTNTGVWDIDMRQADLVHVNQQLTTTHHPEVRRNLLRQRQRIVTELEGALAKRTHPQ